MLTSALQQSIDVIVSCPPDQLAIVVPQVEASLSQWMGQSGFSPDQIGYCLEALRQRTGLQAQLPPSTAPEWPPAPERSPSAEPPTVPTPTAPTATAAPSFSTPAKPLSPLEARSQRIVEVLRDRKQDVSALEPLVGPRIVQYRIILGRTATYEAIARLKGTLISAANLDPCTIVEPFPGYVSIQEPREEWDPILLRHYSKDRGYRPGDSIKVRHGQGLGGELIETALDALLIAGTRGGGKTTVEISVICDLIASYPESAIQFLMADTKRVGLTPFRIAKEYLLYDVLTSKDEILGGLDILIEEQERRFELFERHKAADLEDFNRKYPDKALPFWIWIADEVGDLAGMGKDYFDRKASLLERSRGAGICHIDCTQRPDKDVIPPRIRNNYGTRRALRTVEEGSSKVIMGGSFTKAAYLAGKGDSWIFYEKGFFRMQGFYADAESIPQVLNYRRSLRR